MQEIPLRPELFRLLVDDQVTAIIDVDHHDIKPGILKVSNRDNLDQKPAFVWVNNVREMLAESVPLDYWMNKTGTGILNALTMDDKGDLCIPGDLSLAIEGAREMQNNPLSLLNLNECFDFYNVKMDTPIQLIDFDTPTQSRAKIARAQNLKQNKGSH